MDAVHGCGSRPDEQTCIDGVIKPHRATANGVFIQRCHFQTRSSPSRAQTEPLVLQVRESPPRRERQATALQRPIRRDARLSHNRPQIFLLSNQNTRQQLQYAQLNFP